MGIWRSMSLGGKISPQRRGEMRVTVVFYIDYCDSKSLWYAAFLRIRKCKMKIFNIQYSTLNTHVTDLKLFSASQRLCGICISSHDVLTKYSTFNLQHATLK